ncbi:hypothetical protein CcCBS67573_g01229 [Chytriomyces confervae]|uniref:Ubinuclein middle domain-containing protein n=1 Tax=Chytriomyces confervae TaxID=246404 RepID=A0A507FPZ5_9FUNG|nr:hypothetical protein CcCBS67573_g01229 [Chytriomyces confervae]
MSLGKKPADETIRIRVKLDPLNPQANVFSFPRLVAKQQRSRLKAQSAKTDEPEVIVLDTESETEKEKDKEKEKEGDSDHDKDNDMDNDNDSDAENNADAESSADSDQSSVVEGEQKEARPRRRNDPTNVYDIDDNFIDDSDMYDGTGAGSGSITDWEYGFFVWRGPVENFHEDIAFQDFFEAPRAPIPKKKRGGPIPKSGGQSSKKATDVSPTKNASAANATSPTSANLNDAAISSSEGPGSNSNAISSLTVVPIPDVKKRKRVSAVPTPSKKLSTIEGSGGDGAESSTAPTPKVVKKKRIDSALTPSMAGVAAAPALASPSRVKAEPGGEVAASNLAGDDEDKKAKRKAMAPLSPAVEVTVNYLKNEREKESFENKKNFPQNLRPPLLEAAKMAVLHDEMDENFIKHMKKILPYNSFTLKRLVGRILLNHAIMQSKINLSMKTTEFHNLVKSLCAQQGIDGPQETVTDPVPQTAAPESISSLVAVTEKKKFRFDEESKLAIWNLLVLEWEQAELTNLLNSLDGNNSGAKLTDANVRKAVYLKLVGFWPSGWMSTNDISREYSLYKRRVVSRVNANSASTNAPAQDVACMYIENATNMLTPDTREVFRILKSLKAFSWEKKEENKKETGDDKGNGGDNPEPSGEKAP